IATHGSILEGELAELNPIALLQVRMTLANAYDGLDRNEESLEVNQMVLTQLEELAGVGHPNTLISRNSLVVLLLKLDRAEESVALGERNLELARDTDPSLRMIQFPFRSNLARALAGAGRFEDAIAELDAVARFLDEDENTVESEVSRIRELRAQTYELWGRPEDAARAREGR
ncbi:MAG: tetratricopeptide repeat protein, partial [Planctomycetota bacterium]